MLWYVYVLELSNWKYYVGSTRDCDERMKRHTIWWVKSTLRYLPFVLKVCIEYRSYVEAYTIERKLKESKSRKIIEEYIQNNLKK